MQRKMGYYMLTTEQAIELIKIPKKILVGDKLQDVYSIDQDFPIDTRIELVAIDDDNLTFMWSVKQSKKMSIRMSLHCQQEDSHLGILRIDYNSGHKNPDEAPDYLPEMFKPYIGKEFTMNESHVHFHITGETQQMLWAIPIQDSEMPIKTFNASTNDIENVIIEFAKLINIKTKIQINKSLL